MLNRINKLYKTTRTVIKPLLQIPIVALIFMLNTVYTSALAAPMGFDANDLRIVITPDHFPIIWRDAQKYGMDFSLDTLHDPGVYACSTFCPVAAFNAGARYYKEWLVPGHGLVTVFYDSAGNIVGTSLSYPQTGNLVGPSSVSVGESIQLYWQDNGMQWTTIRVMGRLGTSGTWSQVQATMGQSGSTRSARFSASVVGTHFYKIEYEYCVPIAWDSWNNPISFRCDPSYTNSIAVVVESNDVPAPASSPSYPSTISTNKVGTTAGSFRVSESGAATYSIPIPTLPGTAGVAPEVSLNYNSNSGNGIAGLGWSLSASELITRCPRTSILDGVSRAINFTAEDRFCLNGQRLIVQSGTYGAPGSTYKTEIDSYVLVTANGGTTGHPEYFTVQAKDGSTGYFGTNANSKGKIGSHTLSWVRDRYEDNVGNDIVYEFEQETGVPRITKIKYAYPTLSHTGTAAAAVRFQYANRPDVIRGYDKGEAKTLSKRLSNIQVCADEACSNIVRDYKLGYLTGGQRNSSRLAAVQECRANVCLRPTTFTWAPEYFGFSSAVNQSTFTADGKILDYRTGDFNGDGHMDLVWMEFSDPDEYDTVFDIRIKYGLSDGNKIVKKQALIGGQSYTNINKVPKLTVLDYNADGRMDVAVDEKIYLATPNGDGNWYLNTSGISFPDRTGSTLYADFNGDGLVDRLNSDGRFNFLVFNPNEISTNHAYEFSGANTTASLPSAADPLTVISDIVAGPGVRVITSHSSHYFDFKQFETQTGDFNRDGTTDLILPVFDYTRTENIDPGQSPGNGTFMHDYDRIGLAAVTLEYSVNSYGFSQISSEEYFYIPNAKMPRVVDINGDGLSDLFYMLEGNSNWYYRLNNGAGFGSAQTITGVSQYGDFEKAQMQFADMNGDGYPDLVWHTSGNNLLMQRWNGTGFGTTELLLNVSGINASHILTDVNGDGRYDYLHAQVNYNNDELTVKTYSGLGQNKPDNVIVAIDNGLGNETTIDYTPLTDPDHYSRLNVDINTHTSVVAVAGYIDPVSYPYTNQVTLVYEERSYNIPDAAGFYTALNSDWSLPAGNHKISKQKPVLEVMAPMYVVAAVESPAPKAHESNPRQINHTHRNRVEYKYSEGKIQPGGHGFLGFAHVQTIDTQSTVVTTTTYRQDYPFIGMPLETIRTSPVLGDLSRSENKMQLVNWNNGNPSAPYQPYIEEAIEETYDLDISTTGPAKTVTINTDQDSYGNVTRMLETTVGGGDTFTRDTVNQYGSSDWEKRMGRLSRAQVTAKRNGVAGPARVSTFGYYNSGAHQGMLEWETVLEPDTGNALVTITHEYDGFGNETTVTKTAAGLQPRTATTNYTNGRFVVSTENGYGQIGQTYSNWNEYGVPRTVTDINGVQSTSTFNTLGELERVDITAPGISNWSTVSSAFCSGGGCPDGALYYTDEQSADGSRRLIYFDKIGREIRVSARGFGGQWTNVDTEYDNLNRVVRVSNPYFSTTSPSLWTSSAYDTFDRIEEVTSPDGTSVEIAYTGFTTTRTISYPGNNEGFATSSKTVTTNALGEALSVVDALDGEIKNYYTVDGELSKVEAIAEGQTKTTRLCYDTLGRKTAMLDPDKGGANATVTNCSQVNSTIAGWWHYQYNAYGELVTQTDPKGQQVVNTYDELGRMKTRLDKKNAADTIGENAAEWFYNNTTSGNGQGQLEYVTATIRTGDYPVTYTGTPGYNSIGQLTANVVTIVENGVTQTHTQTINEYDTLGRAVRSSESASSSDGWSWTGSELRSVYDAYGNAVALVDHATGLEYQRTVNVDAYGNVTSQQLADGVIDTQRTFNPVTGMLERIFSTGADNNELQDLRYQWSTRGNLLNSRRYFNNTLQQQENFSYDVLGRLLNAAVVNGDRVATTYDAFGNIKTKNTYNSANQLISHASVGTYTYHSGGRNALQSTSIGNIGYQYDGNGNIESQSGLQTRTLQHTTFDKPYSIQKGPHTTQFWYGPDRGRFKRRDHNNVSGDITTTWYLGSLEKIVENSGVIKLKRYIGGIAIETSAYANAADTTPAVETNYLLTDHLGSIQTIADSSGNLIERLSFDAWGQRRSAVDWHTLEQLGWLQSAEFQELKDETTRGYTGHEMLDEVGLIHMNGRVYDPLLARFMEADPFVQAPGNLQSYNRYAYVWNNPLRATDPSGYSLKSGLDRFAVKADKFVRKVDRILPGVERSKQRVYGYLLEHENTQKIVGVIASWGASQCGWWGALIMHGYAADMTYAATGSSEAAGKAGHEAGMTFVAFKGIGEILDANYAPEDGGQGFANSGLTETGYAIKIFAHGVIGGISAEMSGGKFGNGFAAAGFSAAAIPITKDMHPVAGTIASAIIGGTASRMTGGKFANGASTAAMGYILNYLASQGRQNRGQRLGRRGIGRGQGGWLLGRDSLPQGLVDSVSGFGSGVSFGLTDDINVFFGFDGAYDIYSDEFRYGSLLGTLHIAATGSGLSIAAIRGTAGAATASNLILFEGVISSGTNLYYSGGSPEAFASDILNLGSWALYSYTLPYNSGLVAISISNFMTTVVSGGMSLPSK